MKKMHITMFVKSVGDSSIMVPDNLTIEEAIVYAKEHISEIHTPENLEFVDGSEELDEENCDFIE